MKFAVNCGTFLQRLDDAPLDDVELPWDGLPVVDAVFARFCQSFFFPTSLQTTDLFGPSPISIFNLLQVEPTNELAKPELELEI